MIDLFNIIFHSPKLKNHIEIVLMNQIITRYPVYLSQTTKEEMKTLEMFLLLAGFFVLAGYLVKRAVIGNRNFFLTGKFSLKEEIKAGGKVLLAFLLFFIYVALVFILFR